VIAAEPRRYEVSVERDIVCVLRDGCTLSADVYGPPGDGRFPVLLHKTPYDKRVAESHAYAHPIWYARRGYLVFVQDVRGLGIAGGEFYPMRDEARDGSESVAWAADLPGSKGAVGMYGFSYVGMTQLYAAAERPPALRAIAPAFAGAHPCDGWAYHKGALALAFVAWWTLHLAQGNARRGGDAAAEARLADAARSLANRLWTDPIGAFLHEPDLRRLAPFFYDWLAHDARDAYWESLALPTGAASPGVPALRIGGRYDTFLEGTLRNWTQRLSDGGDRQRLVVGPWIHNLWGPSAGSDHFGAAARHRVDAWQLAWFDRWLKDADTPGGEPAPAAWFVLSENLWRRAASWPDPGADVLNLYLHSNGLANSINGDGWLDPDPPSSEDPDLFVYDPADPVPSLGGRSCCVPGVAPMGPADQGPILPRNDVLVYTSRPLTRDVEIQGTVAAQLWAWSDADDTDFAILLAHVRPAGETINLCAGTQRARFRESLRHPKPIEPGAAYRYDIQVGSIAALIPRGHRLRVRVEQQFSRLRSPRQPRRRARTACGSPPRDRGADHPARQTASVARANSRRVAVTR